VETDLKKMNYGRRAVVIAKNATSFLLCCSTVVFVIVAKLHFGAPQDSDSIESNIFNPNSGENRYRKRILFTEQIQS
jgi:hypothetical protein